MHTNAPPRRITPQPKSRHPALALLLMLLMLIGGAAGYEGMKILIREHQTNLSRTHTRRTAPARALGPQPLGVPGRWRMTLNATPAVLATWPRQTSNGAPFNPKQELDCYSPANVVNDHAWLSLGLTGVPSHCGGMRKRYSGALVDSLGRYSQMYGVWEAKISMAATSRNQIYDWPAWWLAGTTPHHEIDVAEGLRGSVWQLSQPTFVQHETITPGWHVFGVHITSSLVSWWLDGRQIAQINTADYVGVRMVAILDMTTHFFYQFRGYLFSVPATLKVAWVKAWEHA